VIVRLTTGQLATLQELFQGPHQQWLGGAQQVSQRMLDVQMPAVGWLTLRDLLMGHVFNDRGQRRATRARSSSTALQRIARAVARLEVHPALRGWAFAGHSTEIIPVWDAQVDQWQWSPYPVLGARFLILKPDWFRQGGLQITAWAPVDARTIPGGASRFSEVEHLAFGTLSVPTPSG
jgi:hypothetical protein